MLAVFVGLLVLTSYFTYKNYVMLVAENKEKVLDRLEAIAKMSAYHLEGDAHKVLSESYTQKDDLKSSKQDSLYHKLHGSLKQIKEINGLTSAVYTLVKDEKNNHFEFIVTSSEVPAFRHEYKQFPEILVNQYDEGGKIDIYASENGVWLSAFAPLKDSMGETVAVIHVDQPFDAFLAKARRILMEEIAISAMSLIVIWLILYSMLRKIIKLDEANKQEVIDSYQIIEKQNSNIINSIRYAERLQRSLMPDEKELRKVLSDSYLMYESKDRVSGDFPWVYDILNSNQVLVAAVDCTGHGVPGALLSIMGHFLLNSIVKGEKEYEPDKILTRLHQLVKSALKQETEGKMSNDGMDIALLKIDFDSSTYQFAGANRPLFHLSEGKVTQVKGSRMPVGGIQYEQRKKKVEYQLHEGTCKKGDSLHIFSDGYQDQIGEETGRRFMIKKMREMIEQQDGKDLLQIREHITGVYFDWKGQTSQLDDVLVIGVGF